MISLGFGANPFSPNLLKSSPEPNLEPIAQMVGIMIEFPEEIEDNPKTSGNGQFLDSLDVRFYNSEDLRCEGYIADSAPHDSAYFHSQMKAVKNYYNSVSNNNVDFNIYMIDQVYTADSSMIFYATSDTRLGELYIETLIKAENEINGLPLISADEVLFVVFHAGLGQDFSVPFLDPTSHDLKSAYIDGDMLATSNSFCMDIGCVEDGILLPETQNMIFFDVVEDIFYGETDLCDIQFGLTGTFAFLMGYRLGLPPLFNTDTGDAGVGVFGLMDHGSNNGRGVIPAPPTAWTRILRNWSNVIQINSDNGYSINSRENSGNIFSIDIDENEYFLIENRSNQVSLGVDIDSLRKEFKISDTQYGHWFDVVNDNIDEGYEIENGVFISFNNYDWGLPGSGLLIWHIEEANPDSLMSGINIDRDHRTIHLEEADGAVDIGFSSAHPLFSDHVSGWGYDMWYADNFYYFEYGNPAEAENNPQNFLIFDDQTRPNTKANDGASSSISIQVLTGIGETMGFSVSFEDDFSTIILSENDIDIIGAGIINEIGTIYYTNEDQESIWVQSNIDSLFFDTYQENDIVLICDNEPSIIIENNLTFFDENCNTVSNQFPYSIGYLASISTSNSIGENKALGDIDNDGLDEIIYSHPVHGLIVENHNGTDVNGFPVSGEFKQIPLIANIIDTSDHRPEIICREGDHITILSTTGDRLFELASMDTDEPLRIVPEWKDGKAALVDGRRLFLVGLDTTYSYWLQPHSRSSNYPLVTGSHQAPDSYSTVNNRQKAYNYPNPIKEGSTTFRFYIVDEIMVNITIYDVYGLEVEKLSETDLVQNEYNEIQWTNISALHSGLYFAEVDYGNDVSDLVRLVIIQ